MKMKKMVSGLAAIVMAVTSVSSSEMFSAKATDFEYNTWIGWQEYEIQNAANYVEKDAGTIYYLPQHFLDLGYTLPASLKSEYAIPEWEDYDYWTSTNYFDKNETNDFLDWLDVNQLVGGVFSGNKNEAFRQNFDIIESKEQIYYIYGYNEERDERIRYKVTVHNYAYDIYEQAADRLIRENIKSGMNDFEKAATIARLISSYTYNSNGGIPIIDHKGNCWGSSEDTIYLLGKIGIKARIRAANDKTGGYLASLTASPMHANVWAILNGKYYIIEPCCGLKFNEETAMSSGLQEATDVNETGGYRCRLLDDGTLQITDIVGLDIPSNQEKWTVPHSLMYEGEERTVSQLKNMANTCGNQAWTNQKVNGSYLLSFPYRQITVPNGIVFDRTAAWIEGDTPNTDYVIEHTPFLWQLKLGKDVGFLGSMQGANSLEHSPFEEFTIKVLDASRFELNELANDAVASDCTIYTKVTDELRANVSALKNKHNWLNWTICDVSDPNNHTVIGTIPAGTDKYGAYLVNEAGSVIYPILSETNSFTMLGIAPGTYTMYYANGSNVTFTVSDADVDLDNLPEEPVHEHSYTSKVTKEPTCTETGVRTYTCECGDTYRETIPAKGHSYNTTVVAPTCTEQGYTEHICTRCGDNYRDAYTEPTGHTYTTSVIEFPTCTQPGSTKHTCSKCGSSYIEVTAPLGHDYSEERVVEPTCYSQGYTEHICSRCGGSYKDNYTPKKEHNYEKTVLEPATCTQLGKVKYTCTECGSSYIETIPALGHDYKTEVFEPTCTESGYTLHICSHCGNSYKDNITEAKGHSFAKTVLKEASCEEDGAIKYTCIRCGESYTETIPATGHRYKETVVEPTVTEKGYTLHTCEICGKSYKDNYTDMLERTYTSTVVKDATCEEDGLIRYICNETGETYTEKIPAKGHKYTSNVVAPTCTKRGYTEHTCSVCGKSYISDYTEPTGHSFGEWEIVEEPTGENSGFMSRSCTKCGHVEMIEIEPAKPADEEHEHNFVTVTVSPTCEKDGYTEHICKDCGYSYKDNIIPATGHSFGDWETIKEATCTEGGVKERVCKLCGEKETRKTFSLGHNYVETVIAPTETEKGYTLHTCTRCGDQYKDNYTDALISSKTATNILENTKIRYEFKNYVYSGKERYAKYTLIHDGSPLTEGVDYTVTYTNNIEIGKATGHVYGIGKYTGYGTFPYYIVPKKPAVKSIKALEGQKIKFVWKNDGTADGYNVWISTDKDFLGKKSFITKKKTSNMMQFKNCGDGIVYYVKVRPYILVDGTRRYGNFSVVKCVTSKS